MAAGDPGFCETYQADPNVQDRVNGSQEDFYRKYRAWIAAQRPAKPGDMLLYFGHWADAKKAMNDGDGKPGGGVLAGDCGPFNEFCALGAFVKYSAKEIADLQASNNMLSADDDLNVAFEAALRKYFRGEIGNLTPLEKATLNGSLFVQVDLSGTAISTDRPDRQLFAIPGFIAFGAFRRPLNDPQWRGVDAILNEAFDKFGSRLINVSGAAQLRLGDRGATFGPIDLSPGFVIMGRV